MGRCPHIIIPGDISCGCSTGETDEHYCQECLDNPISHGDGRWCCADQGYCERCKTSELVPCGCGAGGTPGGPIGHCQGCIDNPISYNEGHWCCTDQGWCAECINWERSMDGEIVVDGVGGKPSLENDPCSGSSSEYCKCCKKGIEDCLSLIPGLDNQGTYKNVTCGLFFSALEFKLNFMVAWNKALARCKPGSPTPGNPLGGRWVCDYHQPNWLPEDWDDIPTRPHNRPVARTPLSCRECLLEELAKLGYGAGAVHRYNAIEACFAQFPNCASYMSDPSLGCCPDMGPCPPGWCRACDDPFQCPCLIQSIGHPCDVPFPDKQSSLGSTIPVERSLRPKTNRPLKKSNIERQNFWEGYTNDT